MIGTPSPIELFGNWPFDTPRVSDTVLHARDAETADLLSDPARLIVWETLRRVARPTAASVLSQLVRLPLDQTESCLDRLARAGLVTHLRARGRRKTSMWRANGSQVVVQFDSREPSHGDHLENGLLGMMESLLLAEVVGGGPSEDPGLSVRFLTAARLSTQDIAELQRRLRAIEDFLCTVANRRLQQPKPGDVDCNHVVQIQVRPTNGRTRPVPTVRFTPNGTSDHHAAPPPELLGRKLSRRELQIAQAMLTGMTRVEVAKHLGLSPHTISTVCKRIFRKLGIQRRSQLPQWLHP